MIEQRLSTLATKQDVADIRSDLAKKSDRSFDFWVRTLAGPLIIAVIVLLGQFYLAQHAVASAAK